MRNRVTGSLRLHSDLRARRQKKRSQSDLQMCERICVHADQSALIPQYGDVKLPLNLWLLRYSGHQGLHPSPSRSTMVGLGLGSSQGLRVLRQREANALTQATCCWCHVAWAGKNAQTPASFRSDRWVTRTLCTCMNKLKHCNRGYLCTTASIRVWLIAAYGRVIWQQASPAEGSRARRLDPLVRSSLPLFFGLALWFSQAEQPIKVTPFPGRRDVHSVCRICFATTLQWCRTPVWPGISMSIALLRSLDSGGCALWPWYCQCGLNGLWPRLRLLGARTVSVQTNTRKSGFARSQSQRNPLRAALFD